MTGRFSRLPRAAVADRRLSGDDLRALAALCCYVDREGRCWVSTDRLASDLGIHRRSVQRHIKTLKGYGYVAKAGTFDMEDGRRAAALKVSYPEATPGVVLPEDETTSGVVLNDDDDELETTSGVATGDSETTPDGIQNDTQRHPKRHQGVAIYNSPSKQPILNSPPESAHVTQRQAAAAPQDAHEKEEDEAATRHLLAKYELLTLEIDRADLLSWIANAIEHNGPGPAEEALRRVSGCSRYTVDALNDAHWQVLNDK
ncbi:helix-turn-helix domain-containing protein [Dongia sp.]|uniref:helix-turn-helix domain-containing protein n=1 Tax=Dongia sp. TaxID=1977262 RepID=UPI0035B47F1E